MSALTSLVSGRAALGAALLVALGAVLSAAPAAAAGGNSTTVFLTLGSCDIRGGGGPWNGKITIEWRAADGTLRDLETVDSSVGYLGQ